MAQVRIEVDAGITVEVVEGSATTQEVAALQAQVAVLTADKAALQARIDDVKAKFAAISAADATEDAARAAALTALG